MNEPEVVDGEAQGAGAGSAAASGGAGSAAAFAGMGPAEGDRASAERSAAGRTRGAAAADGTATALDDGVLVGERSKERLVMRDLMDLQLVASDGRRVGRVDDVQAEILPDGRLVIRGIVTGPQALAGRVYPRLRRALRRVLRDRFEHEIAISEVTSFGPTIRLRGRADAYPLGRSDRLLAERVLRRIPGADR